MKVLDIMRSVTWIAPDTSVALLSQKMRDMDVGALPVVEGDEIVGIVTDRDVLMRASANGRALSAFAARDIMSRDVACCRADQEAQAVLRLMGSRKVRRMPVVNDSDQLVGMISLSDIAHAHQLDLAEALMTAMSAHHPEARAAPLGESGSEVQRGSVRSGPDFGGRREPIMITRAVKRAVARVRGDHPRLGGEKDLFRTLLSDLLLVTAGVLLLAGLALAAVGLVQSVLAAKLLIGVGLVVLSLALLVLWERLFWEAMVRNLSALS